MRGWDRLSAFLVEDITKVIEVGGKHRGDTDIERRKLLVELTFWTNSFATPCRNCSSSSSLSRSLTNATKPDDMSSSVIRSMLFSVTLLRMPRVCFIILTLSSSFCLRSLAMANEFSELFNGSGRFQDLLLWFPRLRGFLLPCDRFDRVRLRRNS